MLITESGIKTNIILTIERCFYSLHLSRLTNHITIRVYIYADCTSSHLKKKKNVSLFVEDNTGFICCLYDEMIASAP